MENNVIGKTIEYQRQARRLTQTQFAKKIGTSHVAISYWERGINIPNVGDCWKMANVLGITIDELVGRDFIENRKTNESARSN